MMDIFAKLPSPSALISNVNNDQELREKLNETYKNEKDAFLAYKLLGYILATNRSTFRRLKQEEQVEIP